MSVITYKEFTSPHVYNYLECCVKNGVQYQYNKVTPSDGFTGFHPADWTMLTPKLIQDSVTITNSEQGVLDKSYHNKIVYLDATEEGFTVLWNCATMADVIVTFVRIDSSENIILFSDADATVRIIGNVIPYNFGLTQYQSKRLTSKLKTIYVV